VNTLIEMVLGNETIMKEIADAGLNVTFNEMIALKEEGSSILSEAKSLLESKDYAGAIEKAIEAMRLFKEAFVGIHRILCEAGVTPIEPERAPELIAQELLVAANRSLERIERIRSLPNASEVEDLLSEAKSLLNGVSPLLEQGNVSEAAHKLGEANRLISKALVKLRHRAENMIQVRAEKFIRGFGHICNEFAWRIREEGLNETEVLEGLGLKDIDQIIRNLVSRVKSAEPGEIRNVIKEIIGDLRDIGKILREVREIFLKKLLRGVKVGEILTNASAFAEKMVRVEGIYCGQRPPEDLQGPTCEPPAANWWILADETGWIYVVGGWRMGIARKPLILDGDRIIVIGRVVVENNTVYIRAVLIVPLEPIIVPAPITDHMLRLSVNVEMVGGRCLVNVSIENVGDEAVVFPNSAYGIVIERKVAGFWVPIYRPIAAQVLTWLRPGEDKTIVIQMGALIHGTYKVIITGQLEGSKNPVMASAEFTIP
ncbi:MAG: hypothetical protein QXT26_05815, partial [Thermoproteota archaeon]